MVPDYNIYLENLHSQALANIGSRIFQSYSFK